MLFGFTKKLKIASIICDIRQEICRVVNDQQVRQDRKVESAGEYKPGLVTWFPHDLYK